MEDKSEVDGGDKEEGTDTWNHSIESLPIIGTSIPAKQDLLPILSCYFTLQLRTPKYIR